MVQGQNEKIYVETIQLFKVEKTLMISSNQFSKIIDKSIGIVEDMRSKGIGPKWVKLGDANNSPVRYPIHHIAVFIHGLHYSLSDEESKELLKKLLGSISNITQYSLKETALLYGVSAQKLKRDIDKLYKKNGKKVNLCAPRYVRLGGKSKAVYQFHVDDIIDHISGLTYTQTIS